MIFCCCLSGVIGLLLLLSKFEHAVAGGPAVTDVNAGVLAIAPML
jgi:hypothetical protein